MSAAILRRIERWEQAVRLSTVDRHLLPCGQDDPYHPGRICEKKRGHKGLHGNNHYSWTQSEGDWHQRRRFAMTTLPEEEPTTPVEPEPETPAEAPAEPADNGETQEDPESEDESVV